MKLADTIEIHGGAASPKERFETYKRTIPAMLRNVKAGGPGSGCHGPNCGRPSSGEKHQSHGTFEYKGLYDRDHNYKAKDGSRLWVRPVARDRFTITESKGRGQGHKVSDKSFSRSEVAKFMKERYGISLPGRGVTKPASKYDTSTQKGVRKSWKDVVKDLTNAGFKNPGATLLKGYPAMIKMASLARKKGLDDAANAIEKMAQGHKPYKSRVYNPGPYHY